MVGHPESNPFVAVHFRIAHHPTATGNLESFTKLNERFGDLLQLQNDRISITSH